MPLPDPQRLTAPAAGLSARKSLAADSTRLRFAVARKSRGPISFDTPTKFLRKGNRNLSGQSGEEMVVVNTMNGRTIMSAHAEFHREPNSLDRPDITASLRNQTHDHNTHVPFGKNLSEKIAPCHFECAAQRHQTQTEKPMVRRLNQEKSYPKK